MKKVVLLRDLFIDDKASLGTLYVYDEFKNQLFKSESLERGWINNENMISCVPQGCYPLKYEYSDKFKKKLWELKNVPNRSECKIHVANYWKQLNGCISPGFKRKYIDNDNILDVTSSGDMLKLFHKAMSEDEEAEIQIMDIRSFL